MASDHPRPTSAPGRKPAARGLPAGTVVVLLVIACLLIVEVWLVVVNWSTITSSTRNAVLAGLWCLIPLAAIGLGIGSSIRYQRQQRTGR